MKHPLLSLSAGAMTLALPLQMLAAYASPSALFWAWATDLPTHDVSAEAHVQMPKEQVFISLWVKGTQEGGLKLSADSKADMTVDVVVPKENVNVRLKMSMITVDGDAYMKINSVSGKMDKEMAALSAELTGKQWIMLPKDPAMAGTDDPFEAISAQMATSGIEVSAADIRQLVSDVIDAGFSLRGTKAAGNNTYTIVPKRGFVTAITQVVSDFTGQDGMSGLNEADVRKLERDILKQLKMEATIKTDAQDKPVSASAWLTFKPTGGDVTVNAKMTAAPHKGAFSVTAPAGAISAEEFAESFGGMGSPFDMFGTTPWAAPDEPTWNEGWEEDEWVSDDTSWDPCEGMSRTERLQATRKGLCGDQRTTSPRRN